MFPWKKKSCGWKRQRELLVFCRVWPGSLLRLSRIKRLKRLNASRLLAVTDWSLTSNSVRLEKQEVEQKMKRSGRVWTTFDKVSDAAQRRHKTESRKTGLESEGTRGNMWNFSAWFDFSTSDEPSRPRSDTLKRNLRFFEVWSNAPLTHSRVKTPQPERRAEQEVKRKALSKWNSHHLNKNMNCLSSLSVKGQWPRLTDQSPWRKSVIFYLDLCCGKLGSLCRVSVYLRGPQTSGLLTGTGPWVILYQAKVK